MLWKLVVSILFFTMITSCLFGFFFAKLLVSLIWKPNAIVEWFDSNSEWGALDIIKAYGELWKWIRTGETPL